MLGGGRMDDSLRHIHILLEKDMLTRKKLERAVAMQQNGRPPLDKVLVEQGFVTKENLLSAKAEALGFPFIDLGKVRIDPNMAMLIPQAMARRYLILSIGQKSGSIMLAMEDPTDAFAKEYVKMRTGFTVQPMVAYIGDLEKAWNEAYALKRLSSGFTSKTISDMRRESAIRQKKAIELPGFPKLTREADRIKEEPPAAREASASALEVSSTGLVSAGLAPPAPLAPSEPPRVVISTSSPQPREEVAAEALPTTGALRPDEQPLGEAPGPSMIAITPADSGKTMDHVVHKIQGELDILLVLARSATDLNTIMDVDTLITRILETAMAICHTEAASILLLEESGEYLVFRKALGARGPQIERARLRLNEDSVAGWSVLHREVAIVNDTNSDPRHCKTVDEKVDYTTHSLLCVPMLWGEKVIGALEMVNKVDGKFTFKDQEYVTILASQAAVAIRNSQLLEELSNFHLETVEIIIDLLASQDPISRNHAEQVARLAAGIASEIDLEPDQAEMLCYAAFLHDIGNIRCPDHDDPAHAEEGARLLSQINFFRGAAPMVRYHHQRFDAEGDADGPKGTQIPMGARILAVAEAFSEGRNALETEEKQAEFMDQFLAGFGSRFDPELEEPFTRAALAL